MDIGFHPAWPKIFESAYGYKFTKIIGGRNDSEQVPIYEINRSSFRQVLTNSPFALQTSFDFDSPEQRIDFFEGMRRTALNRKMPFNIKLRSDIDAKTCHDLSIFPRLASIYSYFNLQASHEVQFSSYPENLRKKLKRALNWQKKGGSVVEDPTPSPEKLRQFHYKLETSYRREHRTLCHPFRFFSEISRHFSESEDFILIRIEDENELCGAAIFLKFDERAEYAWGFSAPAYKQKNVASLIIDHGVRWAISNGCRIFSMGCSDPSDANLIEYKSRWGCLHQNVFHYTSGLSNSSMAQLQKFVSPMIPIIPARIYSLLNQKIVPILG